MFAYWEPDLVQGFKEADPTLAMKPPGLEAHLIKPKETVEEFLTRVPRTPNQENFMHQCQEYLLSGLRGGDIVGKISNMWENAMYTLGYNHPETVKLAYLFCEALDGSKTGIKVDPKYLSELYKKYSQTPSWKTDTSKSSKPLVDRTNNRPPVRPAHLGRFVMDELREEMNKVATKLYQLIDTRDPVVHQHISRDQDLSRPFEDAEARAKKLAETKGSQDWILALDEVKRHVESVRRLWATERLQLSRRSTGSFTDASIESRQDVLRKVSRQFAEGPLIHPGKELWSDEEWTRIKASYAYVHGFQVSRQSFRFAFDVAFGTLCSIKAHASGGAITLVPRFYEGMTMDKKFVEMYMRRNLHT